MPLRLCLHHTLMSGQDRDAPEPCMKPQQRRLSVPLGDTCNSSSRWFHFLDAGSFLFL